MLALAPDLSPRQRGNRGLRLLPLQQLDVLGSGSDSFKERCARHHHRHQRHDLAVRRGVQQFNSHRPAARTMKLRRYINKAGHDLAPAQSFLVSLSDTARNAPVCGTSSMTLAETLKFRGHIKPLASEFGASYQLRDASGIDRFATISASFRARVSERGSLGICQRGIPVPAGAKKAGASFLSGRAA